VTFTFAERCSDVVPKDLLLCGFWEWDPITTISTVGQPDTRDVGFNALAGLEAVSATLALAWARRRVRSRNN
jgi:hypothetical protein